MPSFAPACPQIGDGLPIAVSLVALAMGLNLLELLPLRLPSLDLDVRQLQVPPAVQAYLAGTHRLRARHLLTAGLRNEVTQFCGVVVVVFGAAWCLALHTASWTLPCASSLPLPTKSAIDASGGSNLRLQV
jgi:cytochrome c-type biogenesis protein